MTITLLKKAIAHQEEFLRETEGTDHPQIKEMRLKSQGRLQAYQECLQALRGNTMLLHISSKGP